MKFDQVKMYNIDLTLTDNCNMACVYCFEKDSFNTRFFEHLNLFMKRIDELLDSSFFKNNFHMLNIGFWGGEPTLNSNAIRRVIDKYGDDDRVKFFLFSNGYNIEEIKHLLLKYKDKYLEGGHPKFCIQISYDGIPVHDINRPSKNKRELTSTKVRNNIIWVDENKIPSTIKSTITPATFKYLPDSYLDIRNLYYLYSKESHFRNNRFFPTIDYYNIEKYTESEFERAKKELEESLVKISSMEIDHFKKYNRFFFSWFSPNKALCSAGRDMVSIDIDGKIYKCHGCLYLEEEKKDHYVTDLKDSNFIKKLEETNQFHCHNFGFLPIECSNCYASFCLKCNVVKYSNSDKKEYIDRWRDYPIQKRLCELYKLNGRIFMALNQIIRN